MTGTVTAGTNGSDGFFSSVKSGISDGLGTVFSQVLPVWTAQQLKLQSSNQLGQPTYVTRDDQPRIDDARVSSGIGFNIQRTDDGFQVAGANISLPVLIGGGVLIAGVIAYLAFK